MKFRFFFSLVVGLLLVSSSLTAGGSDSSSTDVPSTTADGGATSDSSSPSSTAASGSSNSPVTTPADASTNTPDPSATTPIAGSTVTGGSSSDAPVVTTPGGPTVSQGPTTTAPLPNVTYSLVQFGAPVCVAATCTYEIDAPVNNQAVLATDQSLINSERSQFGVLQANASSVDANVKAANDAAQAKIAELQALLDQIQTNLAYIQSATKTIQTQQNTAKSSLSFVEQFISDTNKATDSCLYMRCLKPTTPAPPTTTPTPAPTTSPSPCVNFTCPDDTTGATCKLDSNSKPFCPTCKGNFDGYNHCDTISCSAAGTNITVESDKTATWYTTGYNSTSNSSSVIPKNANCLWNLPPGTLSVDSTADFNFQCLQNQTAKITFTSSDGTLSQDVAASTSLRVLKSLLGKVPGGTITLTSTDVVQSFCFIKLTVTPASGVMMAEKNGFFSWLMGY